MSLKASNTVFSLTAKVKDDGKEKVYVYVNVICPYNFVTFMNEFMEHISVPSLTSWCPSYCPCALFKFTVRSTDYLDFNLLIVSLVVFLILVSSCF